jgi:hypothetical protein
MTTPDVFALGGKQDDADAELFALFAEYDRLMDRRCELEAAAEKREWALPEVQVEIGKTIQRGKPDKPIFASTVETIDGWFDSRPNEVAEAFNAVIGLKYVLYRERRAELVADIQAQEAAIAEQRQANRIDELNAQAEEYSDRANEALAKAAVFRPVTIRGAIEMLERSDEYSIGTMFDNAIAALQDIAERAGLR